MEYWEFLLQKEGDRSWLPLEGPIAGILEGRYRIIARSSYCNAPVTFKVAYQDPSDLALINGPQEHTRSTQTNGEGLMVILPFTALKPGEWRFECTSAADSIPDRSAPAPWHYELCLQVDPYEGEPWIEASFGQDDLSNDLATVLNGSTDTTLEDAATMPVRQVAASSSPIPSPSEPSPTESLSAESSPAEQSSEELVPAPAAERSPVEEGAIAPVAAPPTQSAAAPPLSAAAPPLSAEARSSDVASKGEQVTSDIPDETEESLQDLAQAGESPTPSLRDKDRLPPTGPAPLTRPAAPLDDEPDVEPAMAIASPSTEPSLLATLPGDIQIRLNRSTYITTWGANITLSGTLEPGQRELLGAALPATCQLSAVLRDPATQRILVNLQRPLLQVLEGDRPDHTVPLPCAFSFPVELPLETSSYLLLGELSAHALANSPERPLAQQTFTVAADIDVLAKAVNPEFAPETCSNPEQVPGAPTTQHPTFATPGDQRQKPNLDLQFLSFVSAPDGTTSPIPTPQPTPPPPAMAAPPAAPAPQAAAPPSPPPSLRSPTPAPLPTPNFDPLTPQSKAGRFWNRLSAFAQDSQGHWLQEYQDDQAAPPQPEPAAPDAHLTAREILIDPDLDRPTSNPRSPSPQAAAPASPIQPIPVPTLTLPNAPLVCGTPITVHLQVAEVPGRRMGLKLWVQDRQTRQLLEPPRWVLELTPNGRSGLESRTTVIVPPGLLEVQFEAIAIDLETQHTGQKASHSCRCVAASQMSRSNPVVGDGNQLFGSDW